MCKIIKASETKQKWSGIPAAQVSAAKLKSIKEYLSKGVDTQIKGEWKHTSVWNLQDRVRL